MVVLLPHHQPPRVVLRVSDGIQVEQASNSSDWAIVSRAEFGQALLGRAPANGRVRHVAQPVTDIEPRGKRWSLRTAAGETFSAEFLIGADGMRSVVRRHVVGPTPREHLGLAAGYRVQGAPDAVVFQTYSDLYGYLWSFPRTDHASVGIATRLGLRPRGICGG